MAILIKLVQHLFVLMSNIFKDLAGDSAMGWILSNRHELFGKQAIMLFLCEKAIYIEQTMRACKITNN